MGIAVMLKTYWCDDRDHGYEVIQCDNMKTAERIANLLPSRLGWHVYCDEIKIATLKINPDQRIITDAYLDGLRYDDDTYYCIGQENFIPKAKYDKIKGIVSFCM